MFITVNAMWHLNRGSTSVAGMQRNYHLRTHIHVQSAAASYPRIGYCSSSSSGSIGRHIAVAIDRHTTLRITPLFVQRMISAARPSEIHRSD